MDLRLLTVLLAALLAGCAAPTRPDGGTLDAGPPDAGQTDAGAPDAGPPDAGPVDAGPPDAGPLDAGPPDAGRDGGVELLDWREVRGTPLMPQVIAEYRGAAFALGDGTHAIQSDCDAGACTYTWYDDGGAVLRRFAALAPVATDWTSPTGLQFAAVEVTRRFDCGASGFTVPLVEGTWGLHDALTGERLVAASAVVDPGLIGSAFTAHGLVVRQERSDPQSCLVSSSTPLLTSGSFGRPLGLTGLPLDSYLEDDTADGQLIVTAPQGLESRLWLSPLDGSAAPVLLDGDHRRWFSTRGWIHGVGGYPYERAVHSSPDGRVRREQGLPAQQLFPTAAAAAGRWLMVCSSNQPEVQCELVDGSLTLPRRAVVARHPLPALAGGNDFVVSRALDGGLERLDLRTGVASAIGRGSGRVRVVGRAGAVVVVDGEDVGAPAAHGVTRTAVFPLGERLREVLTGAFQLEQPQSDVVFVVSANQTGSLTRLHVWNVATGRVVHVTDQLFYNPPFQLPFTADAACMSPGFVRTSGPPAASATQPGHWLHFTEFVPMASPTIRVHIMPADLSAPPRLVAELPPDGCSPPLISPSGRRLWLPVVAPPDVVRLVLAPL